MERNAKEDKNSLLYKIHEKAEKENWKDIFPRLGGKGIMLQCQKPSFCEKLGF